MAKKWLIGLTVVLLLLGAGITCRYFEVKERDNWTKRSENLLKIKKHPKKPIKNKNLFGD